MDKENLIAKLSANKDKWTRLSVDTGVSTRTFYRIINLDAIPAPATLKVLTQATLNWRKK